MTTLPGKNGMNGNGQHSGLRALMWENHVFHVSVWVAIVCIVALLAALLTIHVSVSRALAVRQGGLHSDVRRLSERYNRLLEDLRATEGARKRLVQIRPRPDGLLGFVQWAEATGASAGVVFHLEAVPPERDSAGQPYPSPVIRYIVSMEGPLENVLRVMHAYQRAPARVRIESAEFRSPQGQDLALRALATVHLAVAIQGQQQTTPP